jgi:hypothetical protein
LLWPAGGKDQDHRAATILEEEGEQRKKKENIDDERQVMMGYRLSDGRMALKHHDAGRSMSASWN